MDMQTENSQKVSVAKGLLLWFNERYGLKNIIGFTLLYYVCASAARNQDGISLFQWNDVAILFIVNAYFLMLRVLDEHKDYETDCLYHKERVLQRGLINLTHLKIVGTICLVGQISGNFWLQNTFGSLHIVWLVALIYTALMTKEFFCKEWLEQRLWLYGLSHMLVMLPLALWVYQLANANNSLVFSTAVIAMMGLVFLGGAMAEVSRKVRAPEDERDGVDSYTKNLGVKGTMLVLAVIAALLTLPCFLVFQAQSLGVKDLWYLAPLIFGLVLFLLTAIGFAKAPDSKGAKKLEGMALVHLLLSYISFIVIQS